MTVAAETIKTNFKSLPNDLVEITLEGSYSFYQGYGKVLSKPHPLGYVRIMLDNGDVILLDKINKELLVYPTEDYQEFNFTEIYQSVLAA